MRFRPKKITFTVQYTAYTTDNNEDDDNTPTQLRLRLHKTATTITIVKTAKKEI